MNHDREVVNSGSEGGKVRNDDRSRLDGIKELPIAPLNTFTVIW